MADKQDFYLGQIVTEGEMDTIYTDMIAAERNMAKEANLGQGPVAGGTQSGGILSGLVVTKNTITSLAVTLGAARDSNGKRISLPSAATVSLQNLGDTPEGDVTDATGDGSLLASSITAGEAWVSLFLVFDTNLSDSRVDSLNNTINFRQKESFHFNIAVGTDSAPPATARPSLDDGKVLLADILCDNNGEIRNISAIDAIVSSSRDLADIGYGLDDAAALAGRRSDWIALDPDGVNLELWHNAAESGGPNGKAYFGIRGGDPRKMMLDFAQFYNEDGDATKVAGSELIGAKQTTGAVLSAPGAAAALNLAATASIHDQLVQLRDKVNTLMSRGSDTLTGTLTVTGNVVVQTDLTVTGNATLPTIVGPTSFTTGLATFQAGVQIDTTLNVDGATTLAETTIAPDGAGQDGLIVSGKNMDLTELGTQYPEIRKVIRDPISAEIAAGFGMDALGLRNYPTGFFRTNFRMISDEATGDTLANLPKYLGGMWRYIINSGSPTVTPGLFNHDGGVKMGGTALRVEIDTLNDDVSMNGSSAFGEGIWKATNLPMWKFAFSVDGAASWNSDVRIEVGIANGITDTNRNFYIRFDSVAGSISNQYFDGAGFGTTNVLQASDPAVGAVYIVRMGFLTLSKFYFSVRRWDSGGSVLVGEQEYDAIADGRAAFAFNERQYPYARFIRFNSGPAGNFSIYLHEAIGAEAFILPGS